MKYFNVAKYFDEVFRSIIEVFRFSISNVCYTNNIVDVISIIHNNMKINNIEKITKIKGSVKKSALNERN